MKKLFILSIVLLLSISVFSQTEIFKSTPIIEDMLHYVKTIEEKELEVVFTQTDIISKNYPKSIIRTLYDEWSYDIFVFSDWRVSQIAVDIFKLTEDGKSILVKSSRTSKNFASLEIVPNEIATYMIVITAIETIPGTDIGHYGVLIFHE